MAELAMPSLGADMTEGKIIEWLVKPGDVVHRGDIVASVDTSKAEIDVEIFEDGVIDELLVEPGVTVPVGTPLARVRTAGAHAPPPAPVPPAVPVPAPAPAPSPAPRPAPPIAQLSHGGDGGRRPVSPVARRMALDLGVDLTQLEGTGPHGSVCRADVERAAGAGAPATRGRPAVPGTPDRTQSMRAAIAQLMARSKREVPHYYMATEIDLSRALAWLRDANRERTIAERLVPATLLLAAAARAARAVPELNGFWEQDRFRPAQQVHLGVAISLRGGGLIAPAIHDADTLTPDELMRALRDLARRARSGRLRAAEMRDPTITVTNLGDLGVPVVYGVIYPPQVALVGFGSIAERPWAQDGMVGARATVTATLSADHRASDGHRGAVLLSTIDRLLQAPEEL